MATAFLILIGCQLVGEALRTALALPIPGPVIAMFLLTLILIAANSRQPTALGTVRLALDKTSEGLISQMGLLFVPAGVGIIAQIGLVEQEWLPIIAALVGSTLLSVAATGFTMHWLLRGDRSNPNTDAVLQETSK